MGAVPQSGEWLDAYRGVLEFGLLGIGRAPALMSYDQICAVREFLLR